MPKAIGWKLPGRSVPSGCPFAATPEESPNVSLPEDQFPGAEQAAAEVGV